MANAEELRQKWKMEAMNKTTKGRRLLNSIMKDDQLIALTELFDEIGAVLNGLDSEPLPLHKHQRHAELRKRLKVFTGEK